MSTASLRSWLALRAVRGLDDATVCRLVQTFGSPEAVQAASIDSLMASGCISASLAQAIRRGPDDHTQQGLDRDLKTLERLQLSVVTCLDPDYPPRLKMIHDPPPLLYVSGALTQADRHAVAIVGARRATAAGRLLTEELSRDLASAG